MALPGRKQEWDDENATSPFCLVFAGSTLPGPRVPGLGPGLVPPSASPARGAWLPGGRSYLGLSLGRSRYNVSCGTRLCLRRQRPPVQLYAGTMIGNFWGVELGYLDMAASRARAGTRARA